MAEAPQGRHSAPLVATPLRRAIQEKWETTCWAERGSVPLLKDPWKITSETCQGWWFPFCQPVCALKMPPWSTEGCMVEMSLRAWERPRWDLSIKTSQAPSFAHLFSWLRTQYLQPDPLFWTSFWKAKWWLLPQDSSTTQLWKCWSDAS